MKKIEQPIPKQPFAKKIDEIFKANGWKDSQLAPVVSASTIQTIRNQNYTPTEKYVGKLVHAINAIKPGLNIKYDELISLRNQQELGKPSKVSKSDHAPVTAPPSKLSKQLLDNISRLQTNEKIRECIFRVISHPAYPRIMAIAGDLVPNPIWNDFAEKERMELLSLHELDGPSPPTIMHVDMFLVRRDYKRGNGELYTYYSHSFKSYLVPFREWLKEDNQSHRHQLNAEHLAKIVDCSAVVTPESEKFAVSVKQNKNHNGLTIYVFEFCSVVFTSDPSFPNEKVVVDGKKIPRNIWLPLDALRTDISSRKVNGDVALAILNLYSLSLGKLPVSIPQKPATKARKK